ncbi:DUF1284 domain-containing protein [Rummeliibacillus stabekisii]|uniref:DUF1284 domain-containing protein n=1 Tax=Rummeliibacillus stabekisii TaxID=241244 RepID=UPI00371B6786
MYKLRGHHLFCLLGYRGMGYSEEYVENMTKLHQTLRKEPSTLIQVVKGPDHLCDKFPESGEYHCQDQDIYKMDQAILNKLGLQYGQSISWSDIEARVKNNVVPLDIGTVCATCSWRSLGVCEEGIQYIHEGKGLVEVK